MARRGSAIGFHLLWHTVEFLWVLASVYHSDYFDFYVFRYDALTKVGGFMGTESLCISLLRVASGTRVKLAGRKVLYPPPPPTHTHTPIPYPPTPPPVVYSTDRPKAVVPVLVLFFVALLFILRGDLF